MAAVPLDGAAERREPFLEALGSCRDLRGEEDVEVPSGSGGSTGTPGGTAASTLASSSPLVPPGQHEQQAAERARQESTGAILVALAVLVAASQASVFQILHNHDPHVIAECHVLCASNVVGLVTLTPFFHRDFAWSKLRAVRRSEWIALFASTLLFSVVGPLFQLRALTKISVPAAATLQRVQSVVFFLVSMPVLQVPFHWWDAANASLTLVGVAASLVLAPFFGEKMTFDEGDVYVCISATAYALSLVVTKKWLTGVPTGLLASYRLAVGTVLYHLYMGYTSGVYGLEQFVSAGLWSYMWWYGLIYATLFQILWLTGLKKASPAFIGTITTSQFVLTLLWALALQQRVPSPPQMVAAALLMIAIASGIAKEVRMQRAAKKRITSSLSESDASTALGSRTASSASLASFQLG